MGIPPKRFRFALAPMIAMDRGRKRGFKFRIPVMMGLFLPHLKRDFPVHRRWMFHSPEFPFYISDRIVDFPLGCPAAQFLSRIA